MRRCFLIAWRVTSEPSVSRESDIGPSRHSRATTASRVGSPSAANTGADAAESTRGASLLGLPGDIRVDVPDLRGPSLVVHAAGLVAPRQWDRVEAGLDH